MSYSADLILKNARVITCDPFHPAAEALAIKGDRILLAGSEEDADLVGGHNTRVIDCQGKTLIPGFNDAHCHILSFVRQLFSLDLSPASVRSIDDIKTAIRRKIVLTPKGDWVHGSGYNEYYLAERRHPTRWDMDEVSPDHPLIITHRSRHACVLNSLAMHLTGITGESEAPPGGVIERDLDTGEPNGLLFEMLEFIKSKMGTPLSQSEIDWGVAEADRHFLSLGITSLGDATVSNNFSQWQLFGKLKQEGKLHSRINLMPGMAALPEFQSSGLITGWGDEHLRLGNLKVVLSEADGQLFPSQADLNRMVLHAVQSRFQVAFHAVERSTVEAAIIALESLPEQPTGSAFHPRHRIEHCSECPSDLRKRLGRLQTIIVSQPPFLFYHGERYLSQVSLEAQNWLYPFKSLMKCGLKIAGSSDSPIVPGNPLTGIYAAVTRLAENGQGVLPSEAISSRQALEMYTRFAAFATFEEDLKGSLSPGKLADVVMLSADPIQADPAQIKDIFVLSTFIGGRVVWEK
jgi:predicted amidohydrolase YtcJ